jgi:hypothetical protein
MPKIVLTDDDALILDFLYNKTDAVTSGEIAAAIGATDVNLVSQTLKTLRVYELVQLLSEGWVITPLGNLATFHTHQEQGLKKLRQELAEEK